MDSSVIIPLASAITTDCNPPSINLSSPSHDDRFLQIAFPIVIRITICLCSGGRGGDIKFCFAEIKSSSFFKCEPEVTPLPFRFDSVILIGQEIVFIKFSNVSLLFGP